MPGPPRDAHGRIIPIWRIPLKLHSYDPQGPHLSIYSLLDAEYSDPEFRSHWQHFTWSTDSKPSSHFGHKFKYEKTIYNPNSNYELRQLDDWFEPGTLLPHASK